MHCSTCSLKWICFSPVFGEVSPDDDIDGSSLVFSLLRRLVEKGNAILSDMVRPMCGRLDLLSDCCACTAAVACFNNEEDDNDLWSITSDMLRFFKIGFF
jgi:hypothetical protein